MGVRIYICKKTGRTFHDANVHLRSSTYPDIRIQKFRRCKTDGTAQKAYLALFKEAAKELVDRENAGSHWNVILFKWEEDAKKLNRNPTTLKPISEKKRNGVVGMLKLWTGDWLERPANSLSIKEGKDLLLSAASEDLAPATIRHIKTYVNLVHRYGVQEGLINSERKSPVHGVPFDLTDGDKLPEILTITQAKMLLLKASILKHPWFPIWATALMTGMRSSELFALRKENVIFEEGIIRIRESWDWINGCAKTTKAGYWRSAPICADLKPIFEACMSQDPESPYLFPRLEEWVKGQQAAVLREFCELIGIPSIKFHTLRACFATHLLIMGVEQAAIMAIGGWSNFKTFKIYIRLAGVTERHKTEELGRTLLPSALSIQEHLAKEYLAEMPRSA